MGSKENISAVSMHSLCEDPYNLREQLCVEGTPPLLARGDIYTEAPLAKKELRLKDVLKPKVLQALKGKKYGGKCSFEDISLSGFGTIKYLSLPFRDKEATCSPDDPVTAYLPVFSGGVTMVQASWDLYPERVQPNACNCQEALMKGALARLFVDGAALSTGLAEADRFPMAPARVFLCLPSDRTADCSSGRALFHWQTSFHRDTDYVREGGSIVYLKNPETDWGVRCEDMGYRQGFRTFSMDIHADSGWEQKKKENEEETAKEKERVGSREKDERLVPIRCEQMRDTAFIEPFYQKEFRTAVAESCKQYPCANGAEARFQDVLFAVGGRESRGIKTHADVLSSAVVESFRWVSGNNCGYGPIPVPGVGEIMEGKLFDYAFCNPESDAAPLLEYKQGIVPDSSYNKFVVKVDDQVPTSRICSEDFVKKALSGFFNPTFFGEDIRDLKRIGSFSQYVVDWEVEDMASASRKGYAGLVDLASFLSPSFRFQVENPIGQTLVNRYWGVGCQPSCELPDLEQPERMAVMNTRSLPDLLGHVSAVKRGAIKMEKLKEKEGLTLQCSDILDRRKIRQMLKKERKKEAIRKEKEAIRKEKERKKEAAHEVIRVKARATEWLRRNRAKALCEPSYFQCMAPCEGFSGSEFGFDNPKVNCKAACNIAFEKCQAIQ